MIEVGFKNWENNWSFPLQSEFFDTIEEARERAQTMYSLEIRYIGNNNYMSNGLETWIVDGLGNIETISSNKTSDVYEDQDVWLDQDFLQ